MSEYTPPVVLPPDDASVTYPIPWPDYVPPSGAEVIGWPEDPEAEAEEPAPESTPTTKG